MPENPTSPSDVAEALLAAIKQAASDSAGSSAGPAAQYGQAAHELAKAYEIVRQDA